MAARLLLRRRSGLSFGLLPWQVVFIPPLFYVSVYHSCGKCLLGVLGFRVLPPKTDRSCDAVIILTSPSVALEVGSLGLGFKTACKMKPNVEILVQEWRATRMVQFNNEGVRVLTEVAAAATATAESVMGFRVDGGEFRWSSCFSVGAARSVHTDSRVARRLDGAPESQHDLHPEHADFAHDQRSVRTFEAPVVLEAPVKLLYELLQNKGFIDSKTRPLPVDQVASQDDYRIVAWYRSIAIGLLKYHSFSDNLSKVRSIVNYFLRWSAIYTLAKKHKSSSSQIIAKHTKSLVMSKDGKTLTAYLTPTEISEYKKRFIADLDPTPPEELIDMLYARLVQKRLLVERCAVKGCQQRHVEMHHIRQIEKAGGRHKVRSAREAQILEGIKALQATLNKKHIPLCVRHHDDLHMGKVFLDDLDMNVVI